MLPALAIDLGTTTGWAYRAMPGATVSGTWKLKHNPKKETDGARFAHLRQHLNGIALNGKPAIIYYEEVHRHAGTQAAHVYGGLLGILKAWCHENKVMIEGIGVGTIKKAWTGKGNASKDEMVAEAEKRGFEPADDNEADALAILFCKLRSDE